MHTEIIDEPPTSVFPREWSPFPEMAAPYDVSIYEMEHRPSYPPTAIEAPAFSMSSFGIETDPDAEVRKKRGIFFGIGVACVAALAALYISRSSGGETAHAPPPAPPPPAAAAPPPPPPAAPVVAEKPKEEPKPAAPVEEEKPEKKAKPHRGGHDGPHSPRARANRAK